MKNKKENKSETIKRIGSDFIQVLTDIQKYLKDERKIKVSLPKLTDKIIKHSCWPEIANDLKTFNWTNGE